MKATMSELIEAAIDRHATNTPTDHGALLLEHEIRSIVAEHESFGGAICESMYLWEKERIKTIVSLHRNAGLFLTGHEVHVRVREGGNGYVIDVQPVGEWRLLGEHIRLAFGEEIQKAMEHFPPGAES